MGEARRRFDPSQAVLVSADSVAELRRCDVFRVIEWAPDEHRPTVAAYLQSARPDLADEVRDCLAELAGNPV